MHLINILHNSERNGAKVFIVTFDHMERIGPVPSQLKAQKEKFENSVFSFGSSMTTDSAKFTAKLKNGSVSRLMIANGCCLR